MSTTTFELDRSTKTEKTLEYIIGDESYDVSKYSPEGWKYEWWWTTGNTNWFIPSTETSQLLTWIHTFDKHDVSRSLKVRLDFIKEILATRDDVFTGDIYKSNPDLETIPSAAQAKDKTIERRKYNYTEEYNKVSHLITSAINDGEFNVMVPFLSNELKTELESLGYIVYPDVAKDVIVITWENDLCLN